jgi:hypothetical protein
MNWRLLISAVTAASVILSAMAGLSLPNRAIGSHSESFVVPGMPFDGDWGYRGTNSCGGGDPANDSTTIPPTHHHPGGGEFGVDYYACTGTPGRFYSWNLGSTGSTYGVVGEPPKGSCLNANEYKGRHYRIDLYNPEGKRGEYRALHVGDLGYADGVLWGSFGNPPYTLSNAQTVYFSTLMGFTDQFGTASGCYDVNNAWGAHWHLEMANTIGAGHYACFYSRAVSAALYGADYFGIAGANMTSPNQACP